MTKITPASNAIPRYDSPTLASTRSNKENAALASDYLISAFTWDQSAEGHDYWDAIYRRLIAISEGKLILPKLARPLADYETPCPIGYNTVIGYLAKNAPDRIGQDNDRDGFWLAHQITKRNLPILWVNAPAALQAEDISQVRIYPETLLRERFGI
jgi:hypothetical protein